MRFICSFADVLVLLDLNVVKKAYYCKTRANHGDLYTWRESVTFFRLHHGLASIMLTEQTLPLDQ